MLHYLRPKHACCAEFSYFHEIVFRNAHVELDAACHFCGVHTRIGEGIEIFCSPSKSVAKFLVDVCSSVVQVDRIDVDAFVSRKGSERLNDLLTFIYNESRTVSSFAECLGYRVEVD